MEPKDKTTNVELKVLNLEDVNVLFTHIEKGEYLIDGELVKNESYNPKIVGVKNPNDIRIVTRNTINSHYVCGEDIMSINDYESTIQNLVKNAICSGGHGYYFPDEYLDEEYEYKKFKVKWSLVKKEIQVVSEPIKVKIIESKYNTGNPFIQSEFLNGKNAEYELFRYNRTGACRHIFEEYMKELGFKEATSEKYDFYSEYHIPSHSGLRYAKALNCYLFEKEYIGYSLGTLNGMLASYNADKSEIRELVYRAYVKQFGVNRNYDAGAVVANFEEVRRRVADLNVKSTSASSKSQLVIYLNKVIDKLYKEMNIKND